MTRTADSVRKLTESLHTEPNLPREFKAWLREAIRKHMYSRDDMLAVNATTAAVIRERQDNGVLYVYTWQRDCDCAEWDTVVTMPATLTHFKQYECRQYDGAEGPVSVRIITREQAEDFEPSFRDRAAEMMNY